MMGMRAKKICMAMLLIVGGIVAVFLAHRKVAEKITEEEYQRFLDGEVPAMKENGKTYFLEDLFGEDVSDVETFLSDIDGDGVKELHIRNGIYYILKEKKGKLTILYEGLDIGPEKSMKYIQNRTNWCWVAACKVVGEQYKKNFTEFAFTLESQETEVAVSNLDGLRTDIVKRRNGIYFVDARLKVCCAGRL